MFSLRIKIVLKIRKVVNNKNNNPINNKRKILLDFTGYINHATISPDEPILKQKAIVMSLRNLNKVQGICNGTRLVVVDVINNNLLKPTIATGANKGRTVKN